jgi:glycosyltransferase involved in cell wall biosynthesis
VNQPAVIFLIKQPQVAADGGVSSLVQIIGELRTHRAIVVTDRHSARVDQWRRRGIETHVLTQVASRGFRRDPIGVLKSYIRYTLALRRLISQSGAKVIHANDPGVFQLGLAAVTLSRGVKIVLNLRDTLDPDRRPPRCRFGLIFGAADHVFFLSHDMADRWAIISRKAKADYSVTYSIVDTERFAPSPPYDGDGPPVVLLSGVIREKKGQLEFLRQVSPALAAAGIATWLVGDFDPDGDLYMRQCAQSAASLGDMVRFLGFRNDIAKLMARSAVVAVASRHEGLVRAMIEGMSCARPIVSFDVCSAREILEQKSDGAGVVVEIGDYSALTKAIVRYCRDRRFAIEAGEKGCSTASHLFNANAVIERYEQVYEILESCA